jgi:uncharacterized damage-inducible protein DinB
MNVSDYRSLLLQMEWADALVWRAVLSARERDDSIPGRMHHFHSTQWAYLQVLQRQPLKIPELGSFPDLKSLGRWARSFYGELPAYRDSLDEVQLNRPVEFPWAAQVAERLGTAAPATAGECLLQLALHTAYHRGQVATRLRERGGDPPMTDFIAWVWMRRPAPDWASVEDP